MTFSRSHEVVAELEFWKPNCLSAGCMPPSLHPAYVIPESIMWNIFENWKLFYCYHPKPMIWEWKCPVTHLLCSFAHGKFSTWSILVFFSPMINSYPFFKLTIFSTQRWSFLLIKSDISILFHCHIQLLCYIFSYFTCVLFP